MAKKIKLKLYDNQKKQKAFTGKTVNNVHNRPKLHFL